MPFFFAFALIYAQFIHSGLGNKGGGVQLVCDCTYGLAWEVIFNGRKDRCVVRVSVFFNASGSVRGYVCVDTHTHTPAAQMGYSMRAQVWDGHLGSRKNPDLLKSSIYVDRIDVQNHICAIGRASVRGEFGGGRREYLHQYKM